MASIAVTYTFANSTTADATQVNQNFSDILNGLSDGTKDISVSAITAAGTATFNGATNFGNATSDTVTITGLVGSSISPSADATRDLGTSSLGWLGLYLGKNSNRVYLTNNAAASASWTFTFPVNAGVAGQSLVNQGSGTQAWKYACTDTSAKSDDYTITDTDMIRTVLVTSGASNRTITLPAAANNTNRIITIKKVDTGAGYAIVTRAGSDTIDGATTVTLHLDMESISLHSDGTVYRIIGHTRSDWKSYTPTYGAEGGTSYTSVAGTVKWRKVASKVVELYINVSGTTAGSPTGLTATLPLTQDINMFGAALVRDATSGLAQAAAGTISGGVATVRKYDASVFGNSTGRLMQLQLFYDIA